MLKRAVHAVHLLLVAHKMLDGGNDTLRLNALDSLAGTNCLKDGIRTKTFPISTALGFPTNGADSRSKPDVDALAASLFANGHAALVHQVLVKGCAGCDAVREHGDMIGLAHTVLAVSKA